MAIFKGAAVAIVTPFFDNGEINYPKLAELLDYQIENGTDAIVICGTTGESSTLSHEEHLEAIRFTVEHVKKRVPVIAGTGSNCTETAIYLSREAEKYGADALLVVTVESTFLSISENDAPRSSSSHIALKFNSGIVYSLSLIFMIFPSLSSQIKLLLSRRSEVQRSSCLLLR